MRELKGKEQKIYQHIYDTVFGLRAGVNDPSIYESALLTCVIASLLQRTDGQTGPALEALSNATNELVKMYKIAGLAK